MKNKVINYISKYIDADEDMLVIYKYGIDIIISKLIHIFFVCLIGYLYNVLFETVLFLIFYSTLREYSGGFHANTKLRCFICTLIVIFAMIVLNKIFAEFSNQVKLFLLLIYGIIIIIFSPQDTTNKPLSNKEKAVYKRKVKKYLLIQVFFIYISSFYWFDILLSAWIIQIFMLLLGYLKNRNSINLLKTNKS